MKQFSLFTLSILLLLIFPSCLEDVDSLASGQNKKSFFVSNSTGNVTLSSELSDGVLLIKFTSIGNTTDTFSVDVLNSDFPYSIANDISTKVVSRPWKSMSELTEIRSDIQSLITDTNIELNSKSSSDLPLQGLFIYRSLVNSAIRFYSSPALEAKSGNSYSNSVYEGFVREMSSFELNEDIILDRDYLLQELSNDGEAAVTSGAAVFDPILRSFQNNSIPLSDFHSALVDYTAANPSEFEGEPDPVSGLKWPSGSDHGCCGNYDGPCYYFHEACWIHDKLCTDCTPRLFCLWGCVPDP